jgi:hypothetical protein
MAHISSLNSSVYTTLRIVSMTNGTDVARPANAAGWYDTFDGSTLTGATTSNIGNVREFPSMGTPANIVNVPVYGQATSSQISGQADAPTLEFTLNYVPTDHYSIEELRQSGQKVAFRVRLAPSEAGMADGDDSVANADFCFIGSIASFEITPSLSDSMQATVSVAIDGDFEGPFSLVGGTTNADYALP